MAKQWDALLGLKVMNIASAFQPEVYHSPNMDLLTGVSEEAGISVAAFHSQDSKVHQSQHDCEAAETLVFAWPLKWKVGWIPYHLQTAIQIEFPFGRINASPSNTVHSAVSTSLYVINDESPNGVRAAGGECQRVVDGKLIEQIPSSVDRGARSNQLTRKSGCLGHLKRITKQKFRPFKPYINSIYFIRPHFSRSDVCAVYLVGT